MTGANEMTTWPVDQLERIGAANEIGLAAIDEIAPASAAASAAS